MSAPTEGSLSTDALLIVNWVALTGVNSGNSAVLAYSLYWDNGVTTAAADIELVDALVTTFSVSTVTGGAPYKFRVRARNIYGYGPYSDPVTITPTDVPGKTATPTVALSSTVNTEVEISWLLPD